MKRREKGAAKARCHTQRGGGREVPGVPSDGEACSQQDSRNRCTWKALDLSVLCDDGAAINDAINYNQTHGLNIDTNEDDNCVGG